MANKLVYLQILIMKRLYTLLILCCTLSLSAQTNWQQKSNIPGSARNHPVTFSIDGKGYVLTGFATPNMLLNDFHRYDPVADSWTSLASFPGGVRGFAYGEAHNGKGYIGFGLGAGNNRLNDLWEYNPSTNTWTQLASCPCTGRRHPAFTITDNGKLYVGMGDDAVSGDLNDWWEYDIATNAWTQKATLPGPRRHHPYYFSIGTDAYVGFGHSGPNIYNDFYRFSSLTGTWTQMRDFPGEARVAGAQFSYGGFGYIISGEGSDHQNLDTGEFFQYDPRLDSWIEQEPHPGDGRWATGTFVIGDEVFLLAGQDARSIDQNDMWSYDLKRTTVIAGTNEPEAQNRFAVYPNPAKNVLSIQTDNAFSYEIQSLDGRIVMQGSESASSTRLDIAGLATGIYLMKLEQESGIYEAIKIIKE